MLILGVGVGLYWDSLQNLHTAWLSAAWGALLAVMLWSLVDTLRGLRVLAWLRKGDMAMAPHPMGLWGEVVDRTRRLVRLRERALSESEQRLKDFLSAIQASPNGVVLLDADSQIEWCNQMAAQQLGLDIPRDLKQRIGNLLRDPGFTAYMANPDSSASVVLQGRNHRVDHPERVSLQRHPYGDGKQLLLTRDVTALEQAEAMRRDFVANVSHEIRTPLTVLSGFVETLQNLPLAPDEQQHYLALMATQAHRMQSLVEDLLTLSRLEGSPVPGYHSPLDLSRLLRDCEQEARALSASVVQGGPAHAVTFVVAPALGGVQLLGDGRELQSAVSNLVSNAVRYTPAGGRIQLTALPQDDGGLSVQIQDSGPGIAPEHVPRLTERFYRVDRSRSRESGGTGLGLAIVKHVMQRHGGSLSIHSEVGQGSCFTLKLPADRWRATTRPATPQL